MYVDPVIASGIPSGMKDSVVNNCEYIIDAYDLEEVFSFQPFTQNICNTRRCFKLKLITDNTCLLIVVVNPLMANDAFKRHKVPLT